MEWLISLAILFVCIGILFVAGELLVNGLLALSRYLRVKEFLVAFTVMAFAASVPNLFVGVTSALQGVPELSFGDVMGNNIVALTLGIALAVLFSRAKSIVLDTVSIRASTVVTVIAATLPLLLISDGSLSRIDGVVLVLAFVAYVYWLFTQDDHFSRPYEAEGVETVHTRKSAFVELWKVLGGMTLLAIAAQGIVYAAEMVAISLNVPLLFMGLVVLGFAGAIPELYFTVISARKGEAGIVIGNLMGAVIVPSTLVLGIVALLHPIHISNFDLPLIARFFLLLAAVLFFWFARTHHAIHRREASALVGVYVCYLIALLWVV